MKTAIVVPNWNGADLLAECLDSLQRQTQKSLLIVVDNGSTDESVDIIEKQFPDVHLIKRTKNYGFTGGVNAGINYAIKQNIDAIALFNNDAIAGKNWLKSLVAELEKHPTNGIITGKLMRIDKKHIDSTGDFYTTWGIPYPRGRNRLDEGQYEDTEAIFGASGGASLYNAKMLRDIGVFDQKFFAYYEDVDISFRAQLAGWSVMYTPHALAYHHVGATSGGLGDFTRYHSIKNFLMLYTKNMPARLYFKYLPKFLYQFARTTARSIIDGKPHIWLKAVLYFMSALPALLLERRKIQTNRKISVTSADRLLIDHRPAKIPVI